MRRNSQWMIEDRYKNAACAPVDSIHLCVSVASMSCIFLHEGRASVYRYVTASSLTRMRS